MKNENIVTNLMLAKTEQEIESSINAVNEAIKIAIKFGLKLKWTGGDSYQSIDVVKPSPQQFKKTDDYWNNVYV